MKFKHYYSWNIQSIGRDHRAATRDGVMGIDSESYVNLKGLNRQSPSVTTSKQGSGTKQLETQKPSTLEEDDSGSDVVIISSNIRKRSLSVTSTPRPRSKRARTARILTDEPQLLESETEDSTGEDESEYEDDDKDAVDPEAQQKSVRASKEFASACRACKTNANKALKTQHDLLVSKLKSEHKHELRELKAEKAKILADTKSKANKEMVKQKTRYEDLIQGLKEHRDEKLEAMKTKHKEAIEEWQDKLDSEKTKIKKLTTQRDKTEAKRKEIEQSAAEDIKTAPSWAAALLQQSYLWSSTSGTASSRLSFKSCQA